MLWILLTSLNIVSTIFCEKFSGGRCFVERILVSQYFLESVTPFRDCKCSEFVIAKFDLRDCLLSKKNTSPNSSSSMISNFNTRPMIKVTFRSVRISEMRGCSSPVKDSGEYNSN